MRKNGKIKFSKKISFAIALIIVALSGISYVRMHKKEVFIMGNIEKELQKNKISTHWATPIDVEVLGAVKKPGIYELTSGDTLAKAIDKAGGFNLKAESKSFNLSDAVFDAEKIYVPRVGENVETCIGYSEPLMDKKISAKSEEKVLIVLDTVIDINKASATELRILPEVGPKTSENIIKYREEHGNFKTIEEIMDVSGVGKKTFDKIKDKIKVE